MAERMRARLLWADLEAAAGTLREEFAGDAAQLVEAAERICRH